MKRLDWSKSYPRYLRRFGLKQAVWFGDYCRFREVDLVARAMAGRPIARHLDVGCAGTLFPYYAAWLFPEGRVYGVDSEANLSLAPAHVERVARQKSESARVRIFPGDARRLPFANGVFDAVTSISVLEHIREHGDTEAVRELARVVRPGGLIVLTVPMAAAHSEQEADASCPYFIRRYDSRTLAERLIDPADPASVTLRYFAEGRVPYSRWYLALKSAQERWCGKGWAWKPLRYFGWAALAATPLASRLFLRTWNPACPANSGRVPGGAVVVLEKGR